jgi:hypothetical protein
MHNYPSMLSYQSNDLKRIFFFLFCETIKEQIEIATHVEEKKTQSAARLSNKIERRNHFFGSAQERKLDLKATFT